VAAARAVARLAAGKGPEPAVRDRGALKRWLRLSSYPIGPSLPIALAQTVRDWIYTPERGRPKAVVFALGEPEGDAREELERAIDSFDVPRDRVIVVTDSFDFAILRELGVAFRRIPTAAELELEFDDPAYRELLERRLDQALGPWHGRWPMRRIGAGNRVLREEASEGGRRDGADR
jgi:hypothetical protein